MHIYDRTVERIKLGNDSQEAREWLRAAGTDYGVIHELSHIESVEVVEECYQRGATLVEVLGQLLEGPENASVDMVLIHLPEDHSSRELLFEFEAMIAEETGFDSSVDEGQMYVLLRWT